GVRQGCPDVLTGLDVPEAGFLATGGEHTAAVGVEQGLLDRAGVEPELLRPRAQLRRGGDAEAVHRLALAVAGVLAQRLDEPQQRVAAVALLQQLRAPGHVLPR